MLQQRGIADASCMLLLLDGRVQGVFFRASTREQALRLGLPGYDPNLHDGRVEVLAYGPAPALDQLCDWLRVGPPQAQVTAVASEFVPCQSLSGFSTR